VQQRATGKGHYRLARVSLQPLPYWLQPVYALNGDTGALVWQYTTGNAVASSPAVANGVVYVEADDGNLYALDAGTGALLWQYATGGTLYASPAVANGTVYVGSFNGVWAFDLPNH
jgi:eukaryotic-like serine/threonine-protein kinase